jgi:biofilm PGA synthesis N-glycosyltransferase PgaC
MVSARMRPSRRISECVLPFPVFRRAARVMSKASISRWRPKRACSRNPWYVSCSAYAHVAGLVLNAGMGVGGVDAGVDDRRAAWGSGAVTIVHGLALLCASGILLVWIVYPALIGSLAARRRRDVGDAPKSESQFSISIIIATRDDAEAIRVRVADCLRGDVDPSRCEVIVGIDARSPHTIPDDLVAASNVRFVRGDEPGGKAATLNAAVRAARHELLVFTDSQQQFEPGAVERLAAVFADERVGAASGRLELSRGASRSPVGRYWSYERWLRRCEATINSCVGATGAIWAIRRSLWRPVPPSLILDDVYTPMRVVLAGHRVAFVDDARATDLRNPDPRQEYRRKVRTLTGVLQLCCWLPELLLPSRNPIWLQFVFHKLLRLLTPYWCIGLTIWAAVMCLHVLQARPVVLTLPVLGLAAATAARKAKLARAFTGLVVWGVTLQAALVVATVKGVRRQWDVWSA